MRCGFMAAADSGLPACESNFQFQIRATPPLVPQDVQVVETPHGKLLDKSRFARVQRASWPQVNEVSNSPSPSPFQSSVETWEGNAAQGSTQLTLSNHEEAFAQDRTLTLPQKRVSANADEVPAGDM